MESKSVCNHTSDKKNRTTAQWESDLFNHEFCYQLIITVTNVLIIEVNLNQNTGNSASSDIRKNIKARA